jgi:hypothetical protein
MKRFWISWWQPGEDHRPLGYPPNESILGWWCSGSRDAGPDRQERSVCAVVKAASEYDARMAVLRDWPEATDWRFCNEEADDYRPGDRFPLSDWNDSALRCAYPYGVMNPLHRDTGPTQAIRGCPALGNRKYRLDRVDISHCYDI